MNFAMYKVQKFRVVWLFFTSLAPRQRNSPFETTSAITIKTLTLSPLFQFSCLIISFQKKIMRKREKLYGFFLQNKLKNPIKNDTRKFNCYDIYFKYALLRY